MPKLAAKQMSAPQHGLPSLLAAPAHPHDPRHHGDYHLEVTRGALRPSTRAWGAAHGIPSERTRASPCRSERRE